MRQSRDLAVRQLCILLVGLLLKNVEREKVRGAGHTYSQVAERYNQQTKSLEQSV